MVRLHFTRPLVSGLSDVDNSQTKLSSIPVHSHLFVSEVRCRLVNILFSAKGAPSTWGQGEVIKYLTAVTAPFRASSLGRELTERKGKKIRMIVIVRMCHPVFYIF